MSAIKYTVAEATVDAENMLLRADEPLATLQRRCGGDIPGHIAIPMLLELVNTARRIGIRMARPLSATDGEDNVEAWVEIAPTANAGCAIAISDWRTIPVPSENPLEVERHRIAIARQVAELTAQLDAKQHVLAATGSAPDLTDVLTRMNDGAGKPWTDFVEVSGGLHRQPLHWRLLDGSAVDIPGSDRSWRAHLLPGKGPGGDIIGFELYLCADTPLPIAESQPSTVLPPNVMPNNEPGLVGRDVAPVLRQPIARIIANAETIRTRLAGPIAEEYSQYAADIAAAGQHLLSLVEDLADLEVVEADDFNTAPDRIDLADVAQRAAGILAVRAQERGISIEAPGAGVHLPAIAEFRRVLQILLNLVGNAIRYAPDNSQVWILLEDFDARARVIVVDQGPGIDAAQQEKLFEKFERLGRNDDTGSGLGLYISRRLARAMGGDLTVESKPGHGARFILDVPGDLLAAAPTTVGSPPPFKF